MHDICTIHDIGEERDRAFLAMEFLDGITLTHLVNRQAINLERPSSSPSSIAEVSGCRDLQDLERYVRVLLR